MQGPPGTGKTTTITGVIGMILAENPFARIHVCAPSNTAVDEIVDRIRAKNLLGNEREVTEIVLRISAMSHKLP